MGMGSHSWIKQVKVSILLVNLCSCSDLHSSGMWDCVTGLLVTKFWDDMLVLLVFSILVFWLLKMRTLHHIRMSGTNYPVTQCHIQEESLPQLYCCESVKACMCSSYIILKQVLSLCDGYCYWLHRHRKVQCKVYLFWYHYQWKQLQSFSCGVPSCSSVN